MLGKTIEIFSAPKGYKGSVRPVAKALNCIIDHGIENDKFAGKKTDRAVMVVGKIAYDIALQNNITLEPGSLGENILTDFDPHTLKIGDCFNIGDVKLEITEACTICSHLCTHGNSLPELLNGHRGVYCKILSNGTITKGLEICKQ